MTRPTRRQALVLGAALAAAPAGLAKAAPGVAAGDDMSLGPANARVTVVEYASLTCPHCAHFNETVFPAFKAKYVDTGKVHYTLKEFLTPPEPVAAAGFLVARCAGKDKYFSVLDSVFKNQEEMFQTQDYRGVLLRIAQSAGLTEAQFNACLNDEAAIKALDARVQRHITEDKITGTPTFFINGKKIAEGEVTMAQLDAAVAEAAK